MDEKTIESRRDEAEERQTMLLDAWVYEIQDVIDYAMSSVSNELDRERLDDDFLLIQAGMSLFVSKFSQAYNRKLKALEKERVELSELLKSKKAESQKAK